MSHAKRRTIKRNTLKPDVSIAKPKLSHKQAMAKTQRRIHKEAGEFSLAMQIIAKKERQSVS